MKNINKVLQDLEVLKKMHPGRWVLRSNGQTLTMCSGKSIWNRENHAKSALASHYSSFYSQNEIREWGFKNGTELAQYLVEIGIIKAEQL